MNYKITGVLCLFALGVGLFIGKSYYAKTETVEVEKEVVRTDVVVREIIRPDGTKETVTTDRSVSKRDSTLSQTLLAPRPDWHVSASYSAKLSDPAPVYGIQIERRILGPFSVGVRAQTDKQIGLVVGYEF